MSHFVITRLQIRAKFGIDIFFNWSCSNALLKIRSDDDHYTQLSLREEYIYIYKCISLMNCTESLINLILNMVADHHWRNSEFNKLDYKYGFWPSWKKQERSLAGQGCPPHPPQGWVGSAGQRWAQCCKRKTWLIKQVNFNNIS